MWRLPAYSMPKSSKMKVNRIGRPLVKTEDRRGGVLVLSRFVELCDKEVVGDISSLGNAVDTF